MSQSDLELRLSRWLDDGPNSAPTDVVEAGLTLARMEPQLRVVALPWPRLPRLTLPDNRSLAQTAAAFAAVALAVIIGIWGVSNGPFPPANSPSPTVQPSASPSPSTSPTPLSSAAPVDSPTAAPTNFATASPTGSVGGWSVPQLIGAGEFDDVSVAVDPDRGTVHVAAAIGIGAGDSRGIVYMTNASGQWTKEQVTVAPPGPDSEEYDGEPDIAVDAADGTVWIAFTRYDCGGCTPGQSKSILVMNNGSGSWSAPQQVAESQAYAPSLAVSNGVAHVAYAFGQMPEQPNYPSYYATNSSGSWVSTQLAPNATLPQLVLDGQPVDSVPPVPLVAYSQPNGVTLTWFDGPDAAAFTDLSGPTSAVDELFLTLDPAGLPHVVWGDGSDLMRETWRSEEGQWSAPADVSVDRLRFDSVAFASGDPSLIASARGLDEADIGPWFVIGHEANATRLASGETTMTDIGVGAGGLQFIYSYAGDRAVHGVWYTVSHSSE